MWGTFLLSVLWKPQVGIYMLAFTLPLQTVRYRLHGMFLGAQFVDLLLLGVVLGLGLRRQKVVPKAPLTYFLLWLVVFSYFSLWEGAYFIDAPLPLWISDARFSDWKNYVEMFFLAMLVSCTMQRQQQVRTLLFIMALSLVALNRDYMNVLSNRDLSHFSYEGRDEGLMGYAGVNGFAAFEGMAFSAILAAYVYARRVWLKVVLGCLGATCIYCLLFSFSRGGYAGALGGLLAVGFLKSRKCLVAGILLLLAWQTVLPTSVQERITMTTETKQSGELADHSAEARLILWQDAISIFKRNPVTGTGFQTYWYMGREGYRDTHNYFLKVLVETGIVGITLFLALLWKMTRLGYQLFKRAEDRFWSGLGLTFLAVIFSAVVANCFGDRWTYQQVDGYLWMLLGCVLTGIGIMKEPVAAAAPPPIKEHSFDDLEPALQS
jgi:O-antigen ligase